MNIYVPSRLLVIYGGKDDTRSIRGRQAFYSDLVIFDLVNLQWVTVSILNHRRVPRFCHVSICLGSKLVLFGGMNDKGFNPADVSTVEFN